VSGKALLDRMITILTRPRPMVRLGDYYGPEPRKLMAAMLQTASPGIAPSVEVEAMVAAEALEPEMARAEGADRVMI
jgi:hypothetical protein